MGVNEIDGEVSDRSIASALLETYNVVSTVLDSDSVNTDLPNMRKIQSAFELGQVSRKSDLCNQVFACDSRDFNLPLPSAARAQQIDCSHLGQICPGVSHCYYIIISVDILHTNPVQLSIGCNLCGMFIPGLCSATCPMAGLFCGGSGYLCAIASGENPSPTPAPARTDDKLMANVIEMESPRSFSPKMNLRNIDEEHHDEDDGHFLGF